MNVRSKTSKRKTSKASRSTTSLPVSAAGRLRSSSPGGPKIGQSGRGVVRAKATPSPASSKRAKTRAISGLHSFGSSASTALQSSLASKLRTRFGTDGSMIYAMTWKEKTTPSGRTYSQLVASTRTTSVNDSGGWPTPRSNDATGSKIPPARQGGGRTKDCRRNGGLADPDGRLSSDGELQRGGQHGQRTEDCRLGVGQADAKGNGRREECSNTNRRASRDRTEGWTAGPLPSGDGCGIHYAAGARRDTTRTGAEEAARDEARLRGRECGRAAVFIPCADGKWRRVPATAQGRPEPALFPLVDAGSVRKRVGILRGSGNAIVSEFTAEFILAAEEARA